MNKLKDIKRLFSSYVFSRKNSNISFWHTPLILNEFDCHNLGAYYINFQSKRNYCGPFDRGGIPLLDYKGGIGLQYNPNAVAQYALGYYDLWLKTKEERYKVIFLKQADWFLNNARIISDNIVIWEYKFDWYYRSLMKAPFKSALAQGQGISVLVRAAQLTGRQEYLTFAGKAFNALKTTIGNPGGVVFNDEEGNLWLEEYPNIPPTHVLNGFIFTLWGVYDYYLASKDKTSLDIFSKGIETLVKKLVDYDLGFWTSYDLSSKGPVMPASFYYHRMHIQMMQVMFLITGKIIFKNFSEKWQEYNENNFFKFKVLLWKIYFKLMYF